MAVQERPPRRERTSHTATTESKVAALHALIGETRLLFHRLRATAAELHGGGELTASLRGVLMSLAEGAPQSVPQMARARPTSRQHVQLLANRLLEEGLISALPNPAHRRSPLLALTRRGEALVEKMRRRESAFLGRLAMGLSEEELRAAECVMRAVRESLADAALRRRNMT